MSKKSFSFDTPDIETVKNKTKNIDNFISGEEKDIVRKTIALPKEQFTKIKIEAARRGMPAYKLWGTIVDFYFKNYS